MDRRQFLAASVASVTVPHGAYSASQEGNYWEVTEGEIDVSLLRQDTLLISNREGHAVTYQLTMV